MDAYTVFASVYDRFMDNVPYEKWCSFIDRTLKKYAIGENIVLDLGCGTGTMTRIMSDRGYDMIGVDGSAEMLEIARDLEMERQVEEDLRRMEAEEAESAEINPDPEAAGTEIEAPDMEPTDPGMEDADAAESLPEYENIDENSEEYWKNKIAGLNEEYYDDAYTGAKTPTMYLCQDMRELELYGTIGACYSSCNSLNYILEAEDLKKVFALVNNYLFPGGIFIFDINTPYKYEKLLADNTIAETRPECSFIWENYYDTESRINEYDLTLFIREDLLDGSDEENLPEGSDEENLPGPEESEDDNTDSAFDEMEPENREKDEEIPFYRFRETHLQKCYTLDEIRQLLAEAGMEFLAAYDNYSLRPVRENSEIITIIAREQGKAPAGGKNE